MSRAQTSRLIVSFLTTVLILSFQTSIAQEVDLKVVMGIRLMVPDAKTADTARLKYVAYCLRQRQGSDACWIDPSSVPGGGFDRMLESLAVEDRNPAYDFIERQVREQVDGFDSLIDEWRSRRE